MTDKKRDFLDAAAERALRKTAREVIRDVMEDEISAAVYDVARKWVKTHGKEIEEATHKRLETEALAHIKRMRFDVEIR